MTNRHMTSTTRNSASDLNPETLRKAFKNAGQDQVFRFWEKLSPEEQQNLIADAREIDLQEIQELTLRKQATSSNNDFDDLKAAPFKALPETEEEKREWQNARSKGEEAIRAGKTAAFTVAGGQGTRLGYDAPKGTFPVTPVSQKSLFQ